MAVARGLTVLTAVQNCFVSLTSLEFVLVRLSFTEIVHRHFSDGDVVAQSLHAVANLKILVRVRQNQTVTVCQQSVKALLRK